MRNEDEAEAVNIMQTKDDEDNSRSDTKVALTQSSTWLPE